MRVLLTNPKLPASFWSLTESCKISSYKTLSPPLGLLTVAALLPPEWQFRLVDLNARELTEDDWQWADLVMITGMLPQREGFLDLIAAAREKRKTSVVGGPYPTSSTGEVLETGVNFLVRGEGESTIPLFLAALKEGKIGGVFEIDGKPDMTASPVPRFDLLNFDDYLTLSIQTSRGCPFDCEFCDVVNLYGRKPRYKAPQQVISELETLYRLGWRRQVFISDDNFIGNKNHARSILDQLIPWMKRHREPFSFWTQTSVNLGQDLEMIDLMTEANFNHVSMGVESPEADILAFNRKYQNVRNPMEESLRAIKANGLCMLASFVIGFDKEKKGIGDTIIRFVEENSIPMVMLNLLYALPNTALWTRLQAEGRLLEGPILRDSHGLGFNFIPDRPPAEIVSEYVHAIDHLYNPSSYLARTYRYFLAMRPTRQALGLKNDWTPEETVTHEEVQPRPDRAREIIAALKFFWRQGLRPSYRWQFWRQLLGIYRKNPSRLKTYLIECAIGEDLFKLREAILQYWRKSGASYSGPDPESVSNMGSLPVSLRQEKAARSMN